MVTKLSQVWNINESDYPAAGSMQAKLRFALKYAILAPSAWNIQPWKFAIGDNYIDVFEDNERVQNERDPQGRELLVSCGAAIFNLRLAMHHYGLGAQAKYFPSADNKNHLVRLTVSPDSQDNLPSELLACCAKRHSYRRPFDSQRLSEDLVQQLKRAANDEGARFIPATTTSTQLALSGMVAEGDRDLGANEAARKEYASWMRTGDNKGDGVPGYALGFGALESLFAPVTRRMFNYMDENAQKDRELAIAAPCVGTVATEADNEAAWLQAGQAMERLLLVGVANGLQASVLNQPISVSELRERLRTLLCIKTGWPQVVLRLGYTSADIKPTPRRGLDEVIISK